jgi:hypothetical protein
VTSARPLLSADDGSNNNSLIVSRADEEAKIPTHMLPKKKMRIQLVRRAFETFDFMTVRVGNKRRKTLVTILGTLLFSEKAMVSKQVTAGMNLS